MALASPTVDLGATAPPTGSGGGSVHITTAPTQASGLDDTAVSAPGGFDRTELAGSPPPLDDLTLRQIDRFVVLRRLGRGGMGSVYAAYDERLARRVALKLLHVELALPSDAHALLVAEAQAMARLSHPNVVQVHELGEHAGQLFIVMEYVEGRTLSDWLAERPRPWPEIVRMFIAAGQGLSAAHRAGVVHRDFKPDNVLVGADEAPRVADFGLAGVGAGGIAGTPAYMSPEQFAAAPCDGRTDQFSLCVALYAALYGQAPFAGDSFAALAESVGAGLLRAPPPSDVPARLHAALVVGLATDPAARYPTMDALLVALHDNLPRETAESALGRATVPIALVVAMIALLVSRGAAAGPSLGDMIAVARAVADADAAAGRAEWVYPAEHADPSATSIRSLITLERLPAPRGEYARRKADVLRGVYADRLVELGDHYWDQPKLRPYARDFYAQALIFRPEHEVALQRGRLTVGQLADLRDQAEQSGFSPEQLADAAPLRILADLDDPDLAAKLAALEPRCDVEPPEPPPAAPASAGSAAPGSPAPEDVPEDRSEATAPPPADPPAAPAAPATAPRREAEPGDPSALIEEAENARRRGLDERAAQLFREALAVRPREATALAALSDIAFDRGDFAEAADLAEQAVRAAPTIAEHHTRLGDARFKLGLVERARADFARALELGDPRARRRLELLTKGAP